MTAGGEGAAGGGHPRRRITLVAADCGRLRPSGDCGRLPQRHARRTPTSANPWLMGWFQEKEAEPGLVAAHCGARVLKRSLANVRSFRLCV